MRNTPARSHFVCTVHFGFTQLSAYSSGRWCYGMSFIVRRRQPHSCLLAREYLGPIDKQMSLMHSAELQTWVRLPVGV